MNLGEAQASMNKLADPYCSKLLLRNTTLYSMPPCLYLVIFYDLVAQAAMQHLSSLVDCESIIVAVVLQRSL